jgi:hypothetical protein
VEGNSVRKHVDYGDCRNGFCMIMAFGNYKGANLKFPELGLKVRMRPGDVIIFKSHLLSHYTTNIVSGRRIALVFYADHNVYIK